MGRHGHLSVGGWGGGQRCRDHSELIYGDLDAIAAIEGGPCGYRLGGKEAIVKGDRAHRRLRVLVPLARGRDGFCFCEREWRGEPRLDCAPSSSSSPHP